LIYLGKYKDRQLDLNQYFIFDATPDWCGENIMEGDDIKENEARAVYSSGGEAGSTSIFGLGRTAFYINQRYYAGLVFSGVDNLFLMSYYEILCGYNYGDYYKRCPGNIRESWKIPFTLKARENSALDINTYSCTEICGDGILYKNTLPGVLSLHQCDDGNVTDADGCNSNCMIEPSYTCTRNFYFPYSSYGQFIYYFYDTDKCDTKTIGQFEKIMTVKRNKFTLQFSKKVSFTAPQLENAFDIFIDEEVVTATTQENDNARS
jgi:cysteine-rich repeat protein